MVGTSQELLDHENPRQDFPGIERTAVPVEEIKKRDQTSVRQDEERKSMWT